MRVEHMVHGEYLILGVDCCVPCPAFLDSNEKSYENPTVLSDL